MDRQMTAQEIARATLDSIELVRLACEGKPRKGEDGTRNAFSEMSGNGDVPEWLVGQFSKKGKL